MTRKTYWQTLTEDILQNKRLLFFTILTTVLCFGFTITNFSMGIDDCARNYYFYSNSPGSMIQQGRLLHVALNLLTRSIEFIPFFTDFVGAALFALSALLYCALYQYISGNRIPLAALLSFSCVYISYPITVEKYIYNLDVIATMVSYCCSAVSLMYAYRFVNEKHPLLFCKSVAVLMAAVGSYESYMFLYFCGVFSVLILDILFNDSRKNFRSILIDGLKYAAILIAALVLYYGLVQLVQLATGQAVIFTRDSFWSDPDTGFASKLLTVSKNIVSFFLESISCRYIPGLVFLLFSGISFVLAGILSFRKKNIWLLPSFLALWFGNFLIHIVVGNFMARAAQTFCFFIAFIVMLLVSSFWTRTFFKRVLTAAVVLLVFVQSADMNRWFYNDYVRYQKETFVIDTIATKLVAEYDVSKPVVFTNSPYSGYLDTTLYPGKQVIGNSLIYWTGYAFGDETQPFISEVFYMHGYDFITSPTAEQYAQALIEAESMPAWPTDGCIQEFDDFIVVNFG